MVNVRSLGLKMGGVLLCYSGTVGHLFGSFTITITITNTVTTKTINHHHDDYLKLLLFLSLYENLPHLKPKLTPTLTTPTRSPTPIPSPLRISLSPLASHFSVSTNNRRSPNVLSSSSPRSLPSPVSPPPKSLKLTRRASPHAIPTHPRPCPVVPKARPLNKR